MICPNCGKSLWFVRDFCPFCKIQLVAPPRPKSVTVFSWLAVISGIGSAFVILSPAARELMARTSILTHLLTFGSIALQTISGLVMLRGFNWARWAFVATAAYNQLSKVFTGHWNVSPTNILGLLLVATAYYYLFRPAANAFFSGAASPAQKPPEAGNTTSEVGPPLPVGEPAASPKGGPTTPSANSGAADRPPSGANR